MSAPTRALFSRLRVPLSRHARAQGRIVARNVSQAAVRPTTRGASAVSNQAAHKHGRNGAPAAAVPQVLNVRLMSTDTDEIKHEEPKEELIEETEVATGPAETHEFQAETRKILDIVAHSLYSEREVFIREIISNASDALEKLRYLQATGHAIEDPDLPLEIKISVSEDKKTFTLVDTGIGMTEAELVENLGTIAHSGSGKFLEKLAESGDAGSGAKDGIIVQFGVGFYSTFMVGNKVKVYTKSAIPGHKGYKWESDGSGSYTLSEAEGVQRGTKIIIELRDNALQFAKLGKVRDCVQTMSNFVGFPISINGDVVNTIQPLWMMDPKDITEEMHGDFYRFIGNAWDNPTYKLQFKTDVPIDIKSLFYIPTQHMEKFGMGRLDPGVSLYSRKVLIQNKMKNILPDWMRFVKGVVDSPDIPLNLSRELLQDSSIIRKMRDLFAVKIIRHLEQQQKKDPEAYDKWFNEFGNFIREGIATDEAHKNDIAKLLRYESSAIDAGKMTSFQEYVSRMPAAQESIYYVVAPSRDIADNSPYMEAFKEKGIEVLYMYEALDDIVMSHLEKFADKKVVSVSSSDVKLDTDEPPVDGEKLALAAWVKDALGMQVQNVKVSSRLAKSPAIVVGHESAAMRKMLRMIDQGRVDTLQVDTFEINPEHDIFVNLDKVKDDHPELAKKVVAQVFDNALIAAGLMEDPRSMVNRLNDLMSDVLAPLAQTKN